MSSPLPVKREKATRLKSHNVTACIQHAYTYMYMRAYVSMHIIKLSVCTSAGDCVRVCAGVLKNHQSHQNAANECQQQKKHADFSTEGNRERERNREGEVSLDKSLHKFCAEDIKYLLKTVCQIDYENVILKTFHSTDAM